MESRNWLSFLPVATTGWNCIPDLPQTLTKIIFLCWSVNVNVVKKLFRTFPSWRKIEVLTLGLWKPTDSLLKCDILKTAAIRVTWDNPDCNHSYETPSFCLPAYQEGELAWNVGSEQINACLVFNNLMELFCFYALVHICQNLVFPSLWGQDRWHLKMKCSSKSIMMDQWKNYYYKGDIYTSVWFNAKEITASQMTIFQEKNLSESDVLLINKAQLDGI